MASVHIPSNSELIDAFATAKQAGYNLYFNGQRTVIAREKPAGQWARMGKVSTVTVKQAAEVRS